MENPSGARGAHEVAAGDPWPKSRTRTTDEQRTRTRAHRGFGRKNIGYGHGCGLSDPSAGSRSSGNRHPTARIHNRMGACC
eukprot:465635-Pyramimonas_sp.AAC.1